MGIIPLTSVLKPTTGGGGRCRAGETETMKKILAVVFTTALLFGMAGCSVAAPDAGHEGVWVEKPIFFGHGGVDQNPVQPGREFGALTSSAVDVNMLPQRVDMEFDDMMTSSGVPVNFHVVATFTITDPV